MIIAAFFFATLIALTMHNLGEPLPPEDHNDYDDAS